MKKEKITIALFGLFFIGLFVPLEWFKSVSYLGIGIYFVFCLQKGNFQWKDLLSHRSIWLSAFFLLHLIGLVYSENIQNAIRISVLRLPLLIVPLFVYYSKFIPRKEKVKIEFTFVLICLLAGLIGLLYRIFYILNVDPDTGWLYNDNLVSIYGLQAVYFGVYLIIASLFVTKALTDPKQNKKWLLAIALLFCCLFIFLLASRTALLSFLLLNAINIFYHVQKNANKWILRVFILAGVLTFASLLYFFPKTLNRFKSIGNVEFKFGNDTDYYHFGEEVSADKWNGVNARIALWTAALQSIQDQLIFGSGTGDVQDELRESYERLNFQLGLERNFGTHNQYLESLLMFGLLGLCLLLIALFAPLIFYFKNKNIVGFLIFLCFIICFLTEDFLSRNQGVVIFAFFYAYCPSEIARKNQ